MSKQRTKLSELLRQFREKRGYTQTELAERSKVCRGVIINSENDKHGKLASLKNAYLIHCRPSPDEWLTAIAEWLILKEFVPPTTTSEEISSRIKETNISPEAIEKLVSIYESMPINHQMLLLNTSQHLKDNAPFRAMLNAYFENVGAKMQSNFD